MTLALNQADMVTRGAERAASELGIAVVVAIVDAGGHLKSLRRMDGAVLGSIDVAIRKATTAVLFQVNSEAVWDYCKPGAAAPGLHLSNGGLAPFGGGVPLRGGDGPALGAVGVSGGAVAQDQHVALAAAAAFVAGIA